MGNSTGWLRRGEGRWIDIETICNGLWLIENLAVNFPSNATFVVVASFSCTRQQGLRGPVCLCESPGSPRAFVLKCTGGEGEKELLHRHRRPQLYFHRASTISLRHPSSTCMLVVFGLQAVSGLVADCCDYYLVVTAIRCARDEDGCGSMDGTVVEHAAPPFVSCCGYCSLD